MTKFWGSLPPFIPQTPFFGENIQLMPIDSISGVLPKNAKLWDKRAWSRSRDLVLNFGTLRFPSTYRTSQPVSNDVQTAADSRQCLADLVRHSLLHFVWIKRYIRQSYSSLHQWSARIRQKEYDPHVHTGWTVRYKKLISRWDDKRELFTTTSYTYYEITRWHGSARVF